jgi:integrase
MRRANGAGTVRTVRRAGKPDRYQALGPPLSDGTRPSLGVWDTYGDADRHREAAVRQLAAEQGGGRLRGATLHQHIARFLADRERDAPRSIRTDKKGARHILAAEWADDPLDAIATPTIQDTLAALARRLPAAAANARRVLSLVYSTAQRRGLVTVNPVAAVKLPAQARSYEPWTYLLLEEQRALLAAPMPERERCLLTVWLYTGLRAGEILSLRLADVHLERSEIIVRHGSLHGPPKGRRIRTVHLAPPAVEALLTWRSLLPGWLGISENRYGLVFPGANGGHVDPAHAFRYRVGARGAWVARSHLDDAMEAAGILRRGKGGELSAEHRHDGRRPTSHSLRHSCGASLASGWWGEAWGPQEIQAHLGHSTLKQTERYAHLAPSVVKTKAAKLDAVVGYRQVTPESTPSGKKSRLRLVGPVPSSSRGGAAFAAQNARGNPPVTYAAAERCRRALEAAATGDPRAGRMLVDACASALAVLDAERDATAVRRRCPRAAASSGPRRRP